jgi:hypothetical protein
MQSIRLLSADILKTVVIVSWLKNVILLMEMQNSKKSSSVLVMDKLKDVEELIDAVVQCAIKIKADFNNKDPKLFSKILMEIKVQNSSINLLINKNRAPVEDSSKE